MARITDDLAYDINKSRGLAASMLPFADVDEQWSGDKILTTLKALITAWANAYFNLMCKRV